MEANVPLIVAGTLGIFAAAVHGAAGEVLVVRKLGTLPSTALGGPRMTRAMVHVTWHITTVAFLAVGSALLVSGTILDGDAARGIGLVAAVTATGFAALALALGLASTRSLRALWRHPGAIVLALSAALAWWGALT